jgi:hypothetical protein
VAHELVTPRILPRPLVWLGRAIAALVIAWGFLVCVVTISAVLIAIIETWIL